MPRFRRSRTRATIGIQTRLGTVSSQQLNDLNTQLSTARADRAASEAKYAQAVALERNGGSTAAAADVLASQLIQRLREKEADLLRQQADAATRLGPLHPERRAIEQQLKDIRQSISIEINKVMLSLKGEVGISALCRRACSRVMRLQGTALTAADAQNEYERLQADSKANAKSTTNFCCASRRPPSPRTCSKPTRASSRTPCRRPARPSPRVPVDPACGCDCHAGSVAGVLHGDQLDHGYDTLVGEVRTSTGLHRFPGYYPAIQRRGRRATPGNAMSWITPIPPSRRRSGDFARDCMPRRASDRQR